MEELIQHTFERDTKYGVYKDALYFSKDEYIALSEKDLVALEDARVAAWVAVIETPASQDSLKDQLLTESSYLENRMIEVSKQLSEMGDPVGSAVYQAVVSARDFVNSQKG